MRKRNPTIWIVWKILVICTSFHLPYGNYQGAAKEPYRNSGRKSVFTFIWNWGFL